MFVSFCYYKSRYFFREAHILKFTDRVKVLLDNLLKFFKEKDAKLMIKSALPIVISLAVVVSAVVFMSDIKEEESSSPILVTEKPLPTLLAKTEEEVTNAAEEKFVILSVESVKNDLRIKFYDRLLLLYTGEKFKVEITPDGGETKVYVDEDANGRIDLSDVKAGQYKIEIILDDGFECPKPDIFITVKNKVAYKPLKNIKDDIKKESEIDTKKEETKVKDTVQEVVLKDTVAFVKSTETKHTNYVVVPFANVVDPRPKETTTRVEPSTEATTAQQDGQTSGGESNGEATGTTAPGGAEPSTQAPTTAPATTTTTSPTTAAPPTTAPNVQLKDKDGNDLYLKSGSSYVLAKTADYSEGNTFYKKVVTYTYTGWQKLDGSTYYFDKNGNPVTGEQIIGGAKYTFTKTGELKSGSGTLGIDVSKYQGDIDWKAVKASGVQFVIIRCAYRGYGTGVLVEDVKFKQNLAGAKAAGLDIGIYIFSQAINEVEAVEEASACLNYLNGMKIKYPIFIDIETSGGNGSGRADNLTVQQRTNVAIAFCETIKNAGYKPGVYANKNYLTNKMDASKLNKYYIWLAQYAEKPTYAGEYDMWQYTSKGKVAGIEGNVDMNLSYIF